MSVEKWKTFPTNKIIQNKNTYTSFCQSGTDFLTKREKMFSGINYMRERFWYLFFNYSAKETLSQPHKEESTERYFNTAQTTQLAEHLKLTFYKFKIVSSEKRLRLHT